MAHPAWIALLFAATLHAQSGNPLSYPQDTLTSFSSGNAAPFGGINLIGLPSVAFEAHTQLLFPADHLPSTGGTLVGIAVQAQVGTIQVIYSSLNIDASIATATTLSTVFAQNLLAPVPVLAAQNLTVSYTAVWTTFLFTTPFVYPGSLNLVLDIRKVLAGLPPNTGGVLTMSVLNDPPRNDLPPMVYAFGGPGSGASTATVATDAHATIQVRLLWAGIPTMTLLSDRLGVTTGNQFAIGGSITITTYGTPASLYLTQIGSAVAPVPVPPVAGLMYVSGVTLGIGFLNPIGQDARMLSIPSNPALVGLHIALQSAVLDAVSNAALWTCAADAFINP